MMALAGYPLGLDFLFLDRDAQTPGGQVGPILAGELTDRKLLGAALAALRGASRSTGKTFRSRRSRTCPARRASRRRCARWPRRRTGSARNAPSSCSASRPRATPRSIRARRSTRPCRRIGLPGVLKTRRMGYDGKGQFVLRKPADLDAAWDALGKAPLLYENLVPFDAEVSVIAVRGADGAVAFYPLNLNVHRDGILRLTRAPYGNAALDPPGATRRAQTARALQLRRRADHRVLREAAASSSPTKWRRACTTPATGPSKARTPASSRTTCAPSPACRSAARAPGATPP